MAYPDPLLVDFVRGETIDGGRITAVVANSAMEHRLAPMLLDSPGAQEIMDQESLARLTAFDLAVETRQRQLYKVMARVHRRLDEVGAPHTFLKGATSAQRWFDKPTHRPYVDIDVLVEKIDLRRAIAALDESNPALALPGDEADRHLSSVVLLIDGVGVDLQTDALRTGLAPVDSTAWTIGSDQVAISEGLDLPALNNEHDLVMFLIHQGRDRFRYLLAMAEARRRLQAPIDWATVESIARNEGIWEQVAVALEVTCDELGRDVPVVMPGGWRTSLWRWLWRPKVRLLGEHGRIRHIRRARWLMPLTMRGRAGDALRWLWRSALPPDAILRLNHPGATGPYLWRVVSSRLHVIGHRRAWAWRNPAPRRTSDPE